MRPAIYRQCCVKENFAKMICCRDELEWSGERWSSNEIFFFSVKFADEFVFGFIASTNIINKWRMLHNREMSESRLQSACHWPQKHTIVEWMQSVSTCWLWLPFRGRCKQKENLFFLKKQSQIFCRKKTYQSCTYLAHSKRVANKQELINNYRNWLALVERNAAEGS